MTKQFMKLEMIRYNEHLRKMKKLIGYTLIAAFVLFPVKGHAYEFLNAFLHVNLGFTYGFPSGDLIEEERDANFYVVGDTTYYATHYDFSYNVTADLMVLPPIILGNESNAIKFGIRARYNNNIIRQTLTVRFSSNDQEEYGGNLIEYSSWMIGPVLYYSPSITVTDLAESYSSSGGFTVFVLYGRIIDGTLSAYPAKRELGGVVPAPYSSSITGYRIDAGVGGAISIGFINLGMNLYYSMLTLTTEERVYQNLPRENTIHEFCIEIYFGIPFVWTRFPFL